MAKKKSKYVNVRVPRDVYEAIRERAIKSHRTLISVLRLMIVWDKMTD